MRSFTSISAYHFQYETALKRSRMMFRPMNDVIPCNNPCENGGTCEYNGATNTSACKCGAGFNGPTCEHVITEDKGLSVTTVVLVVLLLLLLVLIAGAIAAGMLLQRRMRGLEEEEAARVRREAERAELEAQRAEEGGLLRLLPLESLAQMMHIWE